MQKSFLKILGMGVMRQRSYFFILDLLAEFKHSHDMIP